MASNVTVSGCFRNTAEASKAKHELLAVGFEPELISVESCPTGRAGMHVYLLSVQAGDRRPAAEDVLRQCGAAELEMTVSAVAREGKPVHVPDADRWEQDLLAAGRAGAPQPGGPRPAGPEADVQEQQLPAERVPVCDDAAVSALKPERGPEEDQLEQVTPSDAFSDEEEERLRERR